MASYMTERDGTFESPWKPPSGVEDLVADTEAAITGLGYVHSITVAGRKWRYRMAPATELLAFTASQSKHNPNADLRRRQLAGFVHRNLHPDDAARLMLAMVDPDSGVGIEELAELMHAIGKAGTARPFPLPRNWRRRRRQAGGF